MSGADDFVAACERARKRYGRCVAITPDGALYGLEVVPPVGWDGNRYGVGEPTSHTPDGNPIRLWVDERMGMAVLGTKQEATEAFRKVGAA